jgi:hypothetical protein
MSRKKYLKLIIPAALTCMLASPNVFAVTLEELAEQMKQLAAENAELRKKVEKLEAAEQSKAEPVSPSKVATKAKHAKSSPAKPSQSSQSEQVVRVNHKHSFDMLDPTTNINRKQLLLLENKKSGEIVANSVYLGGAVTAIADYNKSNTDSKFGYLMRHPTANNQRTKTVSEALVHSAQLSLTGNMGNWVTAYFEALYDPEQSFGAGSNTSIDRNQIQMRKAYVLFGNLNESPLYASIGKMATPFGMTDTVNPFTASTVWHAFGGLAYGLQGGYTGNGLNISAMAVQGGAQFRAHNTAVDDSNVPSKLNNFVLDANYAIGGTTMIGASYTKGSAYCQDFPVTHHSSCTDANPAYDAYLQSHFGNWMFIGEYAQTSDVWPGTFNPTIPQYAASKVTSWDIGGRYAANLFGKPGYVSLDFSRFEAGPSGAPWEKQDQFVAGLSSFLTPSVKLFGEYIHTAGYAPLNFVSGGNEGPGVTHSNSDAKSDLLMFGVNAAF